MSYPFQYIYHHNDKLFTYTNLSYIFQFKGEVRKAYYTYTKALMVIYIYISTTKSLHPYNNKSK